MCLALTDCHSMRVPIYRIEEPAGFFQSQTHAEMLNDTRDDYEKIDIQIVSPSQIDSISMTWMTTTMMKTIPIRIMK